MRRGKLERNTAPATRAPVKSALVSVVPARLVLVRLALVSVPPESLALARFALVRSALLKLALVVLRHRGCGRSDSATVKLALVTSHNFRFAFVSSHGPGGTDSVA